MSTIWRAIRPAPIRHLHLPCQQSRHITDLRPLQIGEQVLLRQCKDRQASPILTKPLEPGRRIETHRGLIQHDEIIGRRVRDVVTTVTSKLAKSGKGGLDFRLHEVKLEEYVRLTRRMVTPLYPQDAQLIVGLLDLHPEVPTRTKDAEEPKLEILEAGTGHGALTLFLSRAIHAANGAKPVRSEAEDETDESAALVEWRARRRAILHTIEISPRYSGHAQEIVKGFKKGMYYDNVDFHVGNVGEWTKSALAVRDNTPFLSHAFLDLPNADLHLDVVASALRTDGTLIVFNPSITQIMASLAKVKEAKIPLELERVIELGVNGGTGGREWDVRAVKPRASIKARAAAQAEGEASEAGGSESNEDSEQGVTAARDSTSEEDEWKMVCRPKVGDMVVGGGFLAVFKKLRVDV